MYAQIADGKLVQTADQPPAAWRLKDGSWVSGFTERPDLWVAEGWVSVIEVKPQLGVGEQYGAAVYTVGKDVVTATYPVEAVDPSRQNRITLRSQAETALEGNRTFLAIQSPSNAQVLAQVKQLTRQINGVIRLVVGKLDGLD